MGDFHLIALEMGSDKEQLEQALASLDEAGPGETVIFSEGLAATGEGAGDAFKQLLVAARERSINIITSCNLAPELVEDLPGRELLERYHGVVVFTRFGDVHVPQAKLAPHPFERNPKLDDYAVEPYTRINLVPIDWDDRVLYARFFLSSDLATLTRFSPADLACDLMVVLGRFPAGSEKAAQRLLRRALEEGAARSAFFVNAFDASLPSRAAKIEDVYDGVHFGKVPKKWSSPRSLRASFSLYEERRVKAWKDLVPLGKTRIPVAKSMWRDEVALGEYPVTIMM